MSKGAVDQIIQRAISDAAFRRQLQRDPRSALTGFDLTTDERAAVTSGDPTRLTALGVDQRMSKAFSLGGISEVSKVIVGENTSGSAVLVDENTSGATHGLVGDNTSGTGALVGDDTTGASRALIGDETTGATHAIVGDPSAASDGMLIAADGNTIDAGYISDATSGTAALDADLSSSTTSSMDAGLDGGGDIHPTEY